MMVVDLPARTSHPANTGPGHPGWSTGRIGAVRGGLAFTRRGGEPLRRPRDAKRLVDLPRQRRAHGRDERILVRSLYEGAEFLDRLVRRLAD